MFSYYLAVQKKSTRKKRMKTKRKSWTQIEINAVMSHLGKSIREKKIPGKKQCIECKSLDSVALGERSWSDIKYFAHNYITRCKGIAAGGLALGSPFGKRKSPEKMNVDH